MNYFRAFYFSQCMKRRASWDSEKLREYQDKKVRAIVKYAYDNSRFYREKWNEAGVKPEDVKSVEDLGRLPIVRKEELARKPEEVVSGKYRFEDLKVQRTSGSTGRPLHVYLTQAEDEFRKAKHLRANIALGQRIRDRWVVMTGPQHFGETTRLQRFFGLYATIPVSVFNDLATQVSIVDKLNPDILDGYSNALFLLAKEVEKREVKTIRPRFIIGGSELIDAGQRRFIENVFKVPFFDQYACSELERLAWQCRERIGYHMDADSVIMQFVDEDGEEVAAGESGEVVCTSLFNYAMPFIRYAIDDVGVASEEKCPCGRVFPLMKLLEGRKDSFIVLPDGRVISPDVFSLSIARFKLYDHLDRYRIVQKKVDRIEFYFKMREYVVDREVVENELSEYFRKVLNVDADEVTFKVEFVEDIPLDKSGKLASVVSELGFAMET